MMRLLFLVLVCLLVVWHTGFVLANESNEKHFDIAHLAQSEGLKVRAYADGMYSQDFNRPYNGIRRFNSSPYHVNEFDISYSFVDFTFKKDRFRSTLAVHHGSVVEKMYEGESELWKQFREVSGEYFFDHGLSVEFGDMPSHYGFEGFINKENWFASRAIMTDFAPDFDLGARLNYRPTSHWLFRLQVANGWQTLRETNHDKAFSTLIRYEDQRLMVNWGTMITKEPFKQRFLSPGQSISLPTYGAEYQYSKDPSYERYYSNFFMHYKWDHLWVAYLLDLGMNEHGRNSLGKQDINGYDFWASTAFCIKYFFLDHWAIASRTEYFYDPHTIVPEIMTYTTNGFQTIGETLTLEYAPKKYFTFRLDARYYRSKDKVYTSTHEVDLMKLEDQKYLKRDDFLVLASVAYEFYHLFKF